MLEKIQHYLLLALVFILPLFFLPFNLDFYDFNKNLLLIIISAVLLFLWLLSLLLEKKFVFKKHFFDIPVLLILASYLLSFIFASTNRAEAFFLPQGPGTILALTIIYFFITNFYTKDDTKKERIISALIISASILAVISVYQFLGVSEAFLPQDKGFDFLRTKFFSPAGSLFSEAGFLGIVLLISVFKLYQEWKANYSKDGSSIPLPPPQSPPPASASPQAMRAGGPNSSSLINLLVFFLLPVVLILVGLGIVSYQLLTTVKPVFLPQTVGWVVALETFKNYPVFGIGAENFVSAFTAGKPIFINSTSLWNTRFGISSDFYLQILTTLGFLGLISFVYLIYQVIKSIKLNFSYLAYLLVIIFLTFLFVPSSFLLLAVFYLLLAIFSLSFPRKEIRKESKILSQIVFSAAVVLGLLTVYAAGRVFLADYYFYKSILAASQNKGGETYNLEIKAINLNPYLDYYHANYSQINLALANSIASKKDLNDQDRQNITGLINQAISEAKNAVAVSQTRASDWENLSLVYQGILGVAQGADQWVIASYNQAINLDPVNPVLRLNLGGVYFGFKNYDAAVTQFQTAINLKPDFANAHYNLAAAYQAKNELKQAIAELQQVQRLVDFNSNDYKTVTQTIKDLQAKLPPEEQATPSGKPETLTQPVSSPAAKLKQPIALPENAAPPIASSSAQKEASPSASPSAR